MHIGTTPRLELRVVALAGGIIKTFISKEKLAEQPGGGYRHVQKQRGRCEHVFAEAKNNHGLDRAKSRGLDPFQTYEIST
ncbi:hypothetical protein [Paenibacillus sp. 1P07SE]|uniref:hypothetical protein n=1 Tax=Paenibacillus sp. 1P07SE TaxID=3132209 RepID=UPI0039A55DE4